MQVRLLGDLAVEGDDGCAIEVKGAKLRSLLAVISLHPGHVVPAEQLVDALWGEAPPPSVRNGLQALASKLRRLLGDAHLVTMRGGGYVFELDPERVDVIRFEHLVEAAGGEAAAGAHEAVLDTLRHAESLWRGEPLAEFAYQDFALGPRARLFELHAGALEMRIDALLALGRHAEVLAELEAAVLDHPLREHLRAQLMLALYRSGRQADALRAFKDTRDVLAEELGLDPGPELRQLETAILQQDAALDAPVRVGRDVIVDDTTARGPPTPMQRRWDVPANVVGVIGREAEIAELVALTGDRRLVTLVGPGGVGKTRLALEVARRLADRLANGAVMAELAPVVEAGGVRHALANAMRIPDLDSLMSVLAEAEMVVVLDNCEHVLPAAAALSEELLGRCPRLRVLATSREPLRIGGEHIAEVPPLDTDDAAALFVERAIAAGSPSIGPEQMPIVAEICRRLDGLPLAVELAAARTRAFPLEQLADRLDDRFRLLRQGTRTALPRQQTLAAVVDWSYDLLFDDQRRLLERLSVFPGGFTIESARAVCADEIVDADDVDDIVEALVDKSLVTTTWTADGVRFRQLQTLLDYGRRRLAERDDGEEIRRRMRNHFATLSGRGPAAFRGEDQVAWLTAITAEHDNLRAALDAAIAAGDAETALAIAGGIGWHQWLNGLLVEGREWIDEAMACAGSASDGTRAIALINRGYFDFVRASFRVEEQGGPPPDIDAAFEESVELLRRTGDDATRALVLGFWAELTLARADADRARALRLEEKGIYEQRADGWSRAAAMYAQAVVEALSDVDPSVVEDHYRSAADRFEECGSWAMQAVCLVVLADFAAARDDRRGASSLLEEAVEIYRRLRVAGVTAVTLSRLANELIESEELERAERTIDEALELGRRLASTPIVAAALSSRARLGLHLDRLDDAEQDALAALELIDPSRRPDSGRFRPGWAVSASSPTLLHVVGCVALRRGDVDRGVDYHRRAVEAAVRSQDPKVMVMAASGLADAVAADGDADAADRLAEWIEERSGDDTDRSRLAADLAALAGLSADA